MRATAGKAAAGTPAAAPTSKYPLRNHGAVLSVETWAAETRRLLQEEREEEITASTTALLSTDTGALEAAGRCLLGLRVADSAAGLFGRTVVTLVDWMDRMLPANKFGVGDIVALRPGKDATAAPVCTGVISAVGAVTG